MKQNPSMNIKKRKKKVTPKRAVTATAKYGLFLVYGLISIFPTYWMVVNSFKSQQEIYADMDSLRTFLPTKYIADMFGSYVNLFNAFDLFGRAIFNSFFYATIIIILVLLVNSFAGYALARFRFPGSKVMMTIIILILIVPVETSVIPLYTILYRMGFLSTTGVLGPGLRVVAYIIPAIASPFYIFMFRQFFLSIPKELEEAAKIDGANRMQIYFRIIVPLSRVVFVTIAIFTFMGVWNDYLWPQLLFTDEKYFPLQVFLQQVNNHNPKDISMVMASLTISTIPIALVYIFGQKYITEGVAFTGLK